MRSSRAASLQCQAATIRLSRATFTRQPAKTGLTSLDSGKGHAAHWPLADIDDRFSELVGGHQGIWDRLSFGIPSWAGNESISRNPSRVPILDSCTAHGAFKAADLARLCDVLAAVINRTAFTGPDSDTPTICATDCPFSSGIIIRVPLGSRTKSSES